MRKALQGQRDGNDIGDLHSNPHWPHCFDYLFQVRTPPIVKNLAAN